jgi:hypothetical protein
MKNYTVLDIQGNLFEQKTFEMNVDHLVLLSTHRNYSRFL